MRIALRFLPLLFVVATCRRDVIDVASGDLAAPQSLQFPPTFIGYAATLPLEITDRGQLGRHALVGVSAPFSVSHDGIEVPAGGSERVTVTFTPVAEGLVASTLTLTTDDQTLNVAVSGTGLAQPICVPSGSCRDARFVVDAGACVETPSPDGTACTSQVACLDSAVCIGGECLGQAARCDDGDACSQDACDLAAGCLHFDVSARCPAASDPCHVPSCSADAGCGVTEVPDGTLCGPHDCTSAFVCFAGTCRSGVAVPEGFECAPATPCRQAGRCHNQACVQPPPTPLTPVWRYDPSPAFIDAPPFADALGNAYWVEKAGAATLVSATPQGFIRFRVTDDFDAFMPPFVVGDALVTRLRPGTYRAFSRHDGSRLWDFDPNTVGRALFGSPSLDFGRTAVGAGGPHQLWFTLQGSVANQTRSQSVALGFGFVAVDAETGALRSSTRVRDAGFLELTPVAADEAHDVYLTASGVSQSQLVSLSSAGALRWGRTTEANPSAAYGGRLAVVPIDGAVDAGLLGTVSCIEGSTVSNLELNGLTGPPVLAVFDGAAGATIARLDAGAVFGDCNDTLRPHALFAWDLNTGAMGQHTPVHPFEDGPFDPPASLTLLADHSLLLPDYRYVCPADGGAVDFNQYVSTVRRIALDGTELFACEAPDHPGALVPLGGTRWVTNANPVDHTVIEAFDLPGVEPAAHGWMTAGGNPGRGQAPR